MDTPSKNHRKYGADTANLSDFTFIHLTWSCKTASRSCLKYREEVDSEI